MTLTSKGQYTEVQAYMTPLVEADPEWEATPAVLAGTGGMVAEIYPPGVDFSDWSKLKLPSQPSTHSELS